MEEAEELVVAGNLLELLVAGAIEHVLAVGDVGRVGDLHAGDGKLRVGGAQAQEADDHLAAVHRVLQQAADLGQAAFFVDGVEAGAEVIPSGSRYLVTSLSRPWSLMPSKW